MSKPMIGLAVLVVLIAGGVGAWYFFGTGTPPPPVATQPAVAPPPEPPAIAHPLPNAGADASAPLPALGDSDASILAALSEVAGAAAVKNYMLPENVIRHIVVTIDNLPRQKAPEQKRPVGSVPGIFRVNGDELHATVSPQNYARYVPLVTVIRSLDMQQLAKVYFHFYPLFQSAYQDLGYPNGYFNDRLVEVIDVLLATPQPLGAIDLVRPNVMYLYADPALESRPAGQKLLLRMGPDNDRVIKTKLTELRAALTAAPMKR